MAWPMPRAAPVTSAILPERSDFMGSRPVGHNEVVTVRAEARPGGAVPEPMRATRSNACQAEDERIRTRASLSSRPIHSPAVAASGRELGNYVPQGAGEEEEAHAYRDAQADADIRRQLPRRIDNDRGGRRTQVHRRDDSQVVRRRDGRVDR